MFLFAFWPSDEKEQYHYNKGVEPYAYMWDGTRESLFKGEYGCKKIQTVQDLIVPNLSK